MIRRSTVVVLALLLGAGWLPVSADARTAITGIVKSKAGQPLPGIALTEKGEIHNNVWYRGALVDASGQARLPDLIERFRGRE